MQIIKTLMPVVLASLLTACVIVVDADSDDADGLIARGERNSEAINRLVLGSTSFSITSLLGQPDFTAAYQEENTAYQVLYYRTHIVKSDSRTSIDETTPLIFSDDRLVGWGAVALDNYLN
ncbi:MAG: hypothetical protein COC19_04305 [SAR86 cluster bacterium]|uniref:DUF3192 domain-containing protein n=1 Tax=SAR86 cluster bacterium TaxID=2030880 RepID=A0A2A4MNV5_9GAMM|nr:MAG: hypothetical protein COC19_04305 [SAR86 cluster bacterium]